MVPGLALWLPSGYSWGAALLLLCSLASAGVWLRRPLARSSWWLLLAMLGMGSLWLLDIGAGWIPREWDKPSKYFLALPCLAYALAFAPRLDWLWGGVWLGACGSGAVALYQTSVLGLSRATGYTNAIQYGDLSLLLGLMCAVLLLVDWARWKAWQRLGWALAMLLGCTGSLLSGSRGGWLALVVVLPVCAALLARRGQWPTLLRGAGLVLGMLAALLLFKGAEVEQRIDEAHSEAQVYQDQGNADTSIGHRLAHWQLAWQMGLERPVLGWGHSGYAQEKARRVAAGQAPASVLQFTHAHNEAFDLFAKRGLLGVAVLGLFYGVPLWLFWPRRARVLDSSAALDREALSLCMVGILLPLSYFGFGLTQVFLAHNSGNVFYLFMCLLLHAVLQSREAQRPLQS
ncbi:MAG: O-antigen ligase family protein [Giesbergeria sp.]|nr:O-antigen ligase family protein [Giesbergeria sp.]